MTDFQECPICGAKLPKDAEKCPECGEPLGAAEEIEDIFSELEAEVEGTVIECPVCGERLPEDIVKCPECGEPLKEEEEVEDIFAELEREISGERPSEEEMECPICGATITEDMNNCPECGEPLKEDVEGISELEEELSLEGFEELEKLKEYIECPICGTLTPPDAEECPECGEPFVEESEEEIIEELESELGELEIEEPVEEETEEIVAEEEPAPEEPIEKEIPAEETEKEVVPEEEVFEETIEKEVPEEVTVEEPTEEEYFECPVCATTLPADAEECPRCGESFVEEEEFEDLFKDLEKEFEEEPVKETEEEQARVAEMISGVEEEGRRQVQERMKSKRVKTQREGFMNGLVNGRKEKREREESFINGLKREKVTVEERKSRVKLIASIAVIALIIAGSIFTVRYFIPFEEEEGISIDGNFSDWEGMDRYSLEVTGVSPSITVEETKLTTLGGRLSFYFRTQGDALTGGSDRRADSAYIFIKARQSPSTYYRSSVLDATHMVKITGWQDEVSGQLFVYDNETDNYNWNSWTASGGVQIVKQGNETEFTIPGIQFGGNQIETHFVFKDFEGNTASSGMILSPEKPSLLVQQTGVVEDVVEDGSNLLVIDMIAQGGDVTVDGLSFTGSEDFQSISYGQENFPMTIPEGGSERVIVSGTASVIPGSVVGIGLERVSTDAVVSVKGRGKRYYYQSAPLNATIDGAFGDWADVKIDSTDPVPFRVDITSYSTYDNENSVYFYMGTRGQILGGSEVPEEVEKYVVSQVDSDRDTVPDDLDPYPNDFNNDGVPDTESMHNNFPDVDGDDVPDYPAGNDMVLNTTLPSDFPPEYQGNEVNVWIGPRKGVPKRDGADTIEIFVDIDNQSQTGYSINEIGAEWKVEITGIYGEILEEAVMTWDGEWRHIEIPDLSKDFNRIELDFDKFETMDENYTVVFRTTTWDGQGDMSTLMSSETRDRTKIKLKMNEDPIIQAPEFDNLLIPVIIMIAVPILWFRKKRR